ncbi:MAG: TIM-barrel domain-containing protein [Gemmiger sp.]
MIQRFSFGRMIPTGTVVRLVPPQSGPVPFLTGGPDGWQYALAPEDVVYGLGEAVRGINKRGWHYASCCTDDPNHTEDKQSLYGAHNFFVVDGSETFGVFVDFGGTVRYDVGYTDPDLLTVRPAGPDYDLYLFTGGTAAALCREFRSLVGRSYIPPRWAFGFGQSRWGYRTAEDVRAVVRGYRDNGLPLDAVYLDIDYMQDYADFTVNRDRFPDLPGLAAELKAQGVRLVPILDAGIRQDDGDPTYREALEQGYLCTTADGAPFVGAVWPGHACFADFLRPEVRRWFGRRYRILLDQGVEGFWNDMNEPALFYTPGHLAEVLDELAALRGTPNLGLEEYFRLTSLVRGLANRPEDYASFYHRVPGVAGPVRHDRVHNLYGYHMTRAAAEAFAELRPGKRTLLFSRASCIGAHRYGGIWLGDNCSWWAHLLQSLRQMPGVQMCGFLFCGADLGGFGCDATPDLVLRWAEFAVFTPLMRNHAALGTRDQEFYRFPKVMDALRNVLGIRYGLLPYLYSEFVKAALSDGMYFRPLGFDFPQDADARGVEDQLLLGEGLMIAPVYTQNAAGRAVYLPEPMKLLRLRSMTDYDAELLPAGWHYVRCALEETLLFLRPGHIVPVAAKPALCTGALDDRDLLLWRYLPDGPAEYRMYADDGETTDYFRPEHWRTLRCAGGEELP